MLPEQKQQLIDATIARIQALRSEHAAVVTYGGTQSQVRTEALSKMLKIEQKFLLNLK